MFDLIFIALLLLMLVIGYHRGLASSVIGFVSIIVSAVGGFLLYPYITPVLSSFGLFDLINGMVKYYLFSMTSADHAPTLFADMVDDIANASAEAITIVILNIISVILVMILLRILLSMLKGLGTLLNKIPVVGFINRLLGILFSGISFIIVVYIIVAVMLIPPSNSSGLSKAMVKGINESVVLKSVMDYNFFINYPSVSRLDDEGNPPEPQARDKGV